MLRMLFTAVRLTLADILCVCVWCGEVGVGIRGVEVEVMVGRFWKAFLRMESSLVWHLYCSLARFHRRRRHC